jgi:hypothetical protein
MKQERNLSILMVVIVATFGRVYAQTQVDLRTQAKNVDFSHASSVQPFPTGSVLPALCAQGSMFFNLAAPPGSNLFGCPAPNSWVLETGGGNSNGGTVTAASIDQGDFVSPASGSTTTYVASPAVCPTSLSVGQAYWFLPDKPNGVSGPTLNLCSFGPKTIVHRDGSGLGIGELATGVYGYPIVYDGLAFELGYESLAAGPSGCITVTRTNSQPLVDMNSLCYTQPAAANVYTGANDFSASPFLAIPTGTPATSGAACTRGAIQYDASYMYVCVAANTWRRAALSAF